MPTAKTRKCNKFLAGMKWLLVLVGCWMTMLFMVNITILFAQQQNYVTAEGTREVIQQRKLQEQQQQQQHRPPMPAESAVVTEHQQHGYQQQQQQYKQHYILAISMAAAQQEQPHEQQQQQHQQQQQKQQPQQHKQKPLGLQTISASSQDSKAQKSQETNRTSDTTYGSCSQSTRLDRIKKTCKSFPSASRSDPLSLDQLPKSLLQSVAPNILVSDQFGVLFCINWKTGSSSLRSVLLNNSQLSSWDESAAMTNDLRPLSDFPLSGVRYRLRHYFNVIMVRHPFDRLVSAYNDKLNMDAEYRRNLGRSIIRKYGLNVTDSDYAAGRGVDFNKFLSYILDGGKDGHWEGYSHRCFPCALQYHFVMKTETMDHDLGYIIDKKLGGKGHRVKRNHYRTASRNTRHLAEYSRVSSQLVDDIGKKYRIDMEMFGYSMMKHRNGSVTASCEAQGEMFCLIGVYQISRIMPRDIILKFLSLIIHFSNSAPGGCYNM